MNGVFQTGVCIPIRVNYTLQIGIYIVLLYINTSLNMVSFRGGFMPVKLILIPLLLLAAACARQVPGQQEIQHPIRVTAFPMPSEDPELDETELTVLMHILPDGSVANANIIRGRLTDTWNRAVIDSLLTWRFSVLPDGNPEGRWHRRDIKVQFEEPFFFYGGIFRTDTREVADSLHRELSRIRVFDEHQDRFTDRPEFELVMVDRHDISNYPHFIRRQLRNQRAATVTRPMLYDGKFVLFYRKPHPEDSIQHQPAGLTLIPSSSIFVMP